MEIAVALAHEALLAASLQHGIVSIEHHARILGQAGAGDRKAPVIARDWVPAWRSEGFLTEDERLAIDWQVAHMSWHRTLWTSADRPPWDGRIREWTEACCTQLQDWFAALEKGDTKPLERTMELVDAFGAGQEDRCP